MSAAQDTGEAELWKNVGRLAKEGSNTLIQAHLKQADNQYMNSMLDTKIKWEELADELDTNLDENTYMAAYEKKLAEIKKLRPKNETAGRLFDRSVTEQAIAQRKSTKEAMQLRINDTWQVTKDRLTEEAIRTGSAALLVGHVTAGIEAGLIKKAPAMKHLQDTAHKASRRAGENSALSDPEAFLKSVQGNEIKDMPLLTPGDVQDLRNIAKGEIAFRKSQEDAALSSFYVDISKQAADGMPFGELRDLIRNQPGLTTKEKEKAMAVANSAYRTWDEGGTKENPWKTTQDQGALLEMQVRISQGKPTTEMDIINAQYAQPEKGPLFSNIDRDKLFAQLPDSDKKPELKTEFAKLNQELVKSLYTTEEYESKETVAGKLKDVKRMRIPIDKQGEYQSKLDEVNALISAYPNNPVRAQKEINESLAGLREEKAKGWLRENWKTFVPEESFPLGMRTAFGLSGYYNLYRAGKYGLSLIPQTEAEKELAEMSDEELEAIAK
jgi:hypothetical protein